MTEAPALPSVEELELLMLEDGDANDDVHYVCNNCYNVHQRFTSFCGVPIQNWDQEVPDWVEANCVECQEVYDLHRRGILYWSCPVCGLS